ncbi:MAG: tetratricopeptide repeat protein [Alphaproteobacteria bacterium]
MFLFLSLKAKAESEYVSTNDIVKQIEKSLIFDKESKQRIDVYKSRQDDKSADISIESGKSDVLTINESNINSGIEIVIVDEKKENFDIKEKERLAYNSAMIGQYEVAIQIFKQIIKDQSNNTYAKFSLASVYQKIGQYRQAKNLYHELLKSNYENKEEVLGNLFTILVDESPRDSIYLLSRLSIQNPDSPIILAHTALAYEKIKNYDKAISYFLKAINLDDTNISYKFNLAIIYDKAQKIEKALEMYSEVVKNYFSTNNNSIPIEVVKKRIETIRNKL